MTDKQAEAFARSDARRAAAGLPPVRPNDGLQLRVPKVIVPVSRASGVGSVIEAGTKAVGISPCRGCKQTRDYLNEVGAAVIEALT